MLQQTQVKTVLPYWERWMQAIPDIQALADASPQKIHKLWEGLGYYTRVRNLQRAAQIIVTEHGGKFPSNFDAVLALPGIGRYTAGAICSIAFNQPTPILDGNVIRVLARLYGIKGDPREKKTNAKLWKIAEDLVGSVQTISHNEIPPPNSKLSRDNPEGIESFSPGLRGTSYPGLPTSRYPSTLKGLRPSPCQSIAYECEEQHRPACSHLNQSLMELGALICTPKNPRCPDCPLKTNCIAHRKRIVHLLPTIPRRVPATPRRFFAFVIKRNSRYLVRQRPSGVVNAHLWEFPNTELNGESDLNQIAKSALGFSAKSLQPLRTIKHTITRYRITLDVFRGQAHGENLPSKLGGKWLHRCDLNHLPFSSAHKKILANM